MVRRNLTLLCGAFLLPLLFAGTQAKAERVHFGYNGGRWSHSRHAGWHRYWGGPSIGFYYAAAPVYIVPGYESVRYYEGPDYWYSNPSFGFTYNSGGGYYRREPYYRTYHRGYNHNNGYRTNQRGYNHDYGRRRSR